MLDVIRQKHYVFSDHLRTVLAVVTAHHWMNHNLVVFPVCWLKSFLIFVEKFSAKSQTMRDVIWGRLVSSLLNCMYCQWNTNRCLANGFIFSFSRHTMVCRLSSWVTSSFFSPFSCCVMYGSLHFFMSPSQAMVLSIHGNLCIIQYTLLLLFLGYTGLLQMYPVV